VVQPRSVSIVCSQLWKPQKGMGRVSRCKLVDKVAKGTNNSAVDFEWGKWVVEMEAELC
jgi:hypothetical protein